MFTVLCWKLKTEIVYFKDNVPEHRRRGMMIKQLVKIVTSSNTRQQRKFSKFLEAIDADFKNVKDQLVKVFNDAGLNDLVTGQFPKVSKEQYRVIG